MGDLVARLGRAPQLPEDEAADGVVVVVGERAAELLVEVVDGERAVDPDRVVADPLDRLIRQVELVFDLADDLLEQVLERDDPLHRAVLVDDDGQVLVRAAELREQGGEVLRLGHHRHRTDEVGDLDRGEPAIVHGLDQVADVQHADDVVERLAVHGVAGEGGSSTACSASSAGRLTEIATTSGRGTITSETSLSPKSKTL